MSPHEVTPPAGQAAQEPPPAAHDRNSADEDQRLSLLAELGVLDTDPEPGFDALTHAAATLTHCPIALISLVDGERQWFKARVGLQEWQTPRDWSFCNHAIRSPEILEVRDATSDLRFAHNPLVLGSPHIRFYAGQPLAVDGVRIGTLCVIDTQARVLGPAAREALHDLAIAASALLGARRKRAVSAEQQRRLTEFAMVAGDWLWETDAQHRIVWMSCAYGQQAPLPEPWVLGQAMADGPVLAAADGPASVHTTLHQLFDARGGFARARVRCDVAGVPRYLSHSAVCRRDASGQWLGYRGITRDFTAGMTAQLAQRQAARLLADLSAQVPGVIFQLLRDAQGRLSLPYLSQRVVDLCELQVGQVRHSARALLRRCRPGHAARLLRALQRSAALMTVWQETVPVRLPKAGLRVLQVHAQPRPADGGSVLWHGLLTDITDQLRADAQLQQLIQTEGAASKAAEMRRELLSRVSHEFRTPLNAILGFAQLMRLQGPSQSLASVLVSMQHIEQAGTHLLALVNDLLDLTADEVGRLDMHLQPLLLAPLVERAIDLLAPLARQRGMQLVLTQDSAVPTVSGDGRAIRQVLFNLLGNAIKFAHPDSEVRVTLRHTAGAPMVVMEIQDEGPGMPPALLAGLFQPLPAGQTGGTPPAVTGLGLGISQRLVEAMHGHIELRSVPGQGSRFRVSLPADGRAAAPAAAAPARGPAQASTAAAPAAQPRRHATVLYVEDNPVNALLMTAIFEAAPLAHLRLVIAVNGNSGLQQARQLLPDLILLDMQLPDMNGLSVLQALKREARTAAIPVIAVSADAMPEQVQTAQAAGCTDYWTKPLDLQKAMTALASRFPAALH